MKITGEKLAELLHEELEIDGWGDIDPIWVQMAADGSCDEPEVEGAVRSFNEDKQSAQELRELFNRVAQKLETL